MRVTPPIDQRRKKRVPLGKIEKTQLVYFVILRNDAVSVA